MALKSKSLRSTSDGPVEPREKVAFVKEPKTPPKVFKGEEKVIPLGGKRIKLIVVGSAPPAEQVLVEKAYDEGTVYVLKTGKKVFVEGGKRQAKDSKDD